MWSLVLNFCKLSVFAFPQVWSELCHILGDNCVIGAEDCLVSGLRVMLNLHVGSKKLTNAEVVDAVKIIQQLTKRKSSSVDVTKF